MNRHASRFVDELAATLAPGGRYYLLAFRGEFPVPNTPLKVTEDELRARFTAGAGWRIVAMRPAQFLSRFAPVPSVAACIERLGAGMPDAVAALLVARIRYVEEGS